MRGSRASRVQHANRNNLSRDDSFSEDITSIVNIISIFLITVL